MPELRKVPGGRARVWDEEAQDWKDLFQAKGFSEHRNRRTQGGQLSLACLSSQGQLTAPPARDYMSGGCCWHTLVAPVSLDPLCPYCPLRCTLLCCSWSTVGCYKRMAVRHLLRRQTAAECPDDFRWRLLADFGSAAGRAQASTPATAENGPFLVHLAALPAPAEMRCCCQQLQLRTPGHEPVMLHLLRMYRTTPDMHQVRPAFVLRN